MLEKEDEEYPYAEANSRLIRSSSEPPRVIILRLEDQNEQSGSAVHEGHQGGPDIDETQMMR